MVMDRGKWISHWGHLGGVRIPRSRGVAGESALWLVIEGSDWRTKRSIGEGTESWLDNWPEGLPREAKGVASGLDREFARWPKGMNREVTTLLKEYDKDVDNGLKHNDFIEWLTTQIG